jgi:hypothetical protein
VVVAVVDIMSDQQPARRLAMGGPLNLDHLRAVAEAADENGREWEWQGGYPQRITRVGDVVIVADCFESPDHPSRFAEFIATFDPPTVLALLARREARDG